jgi:MFS family permease
LLLSSKYRVNVLHAVVGAVAMSMIQPFIAIFAIRLGATDLQLGYLSSWPNLASIVAVLGGAVLLSRAADKQRVIASLFLAGRLAFLGVAAVPWWAEESRIWALVAFWVLAVCPQSAAGTGLHSYLADLFPSQERTAVFAARNRWATVAGMTAGLAAGWALDLLPYPSGYQAMFAAAAVVAVGELWLLMRLRDPQMTGEGRPAAPGAPRVWRVVAAAMLADRRYLRYLLVSLLFHFTWQMAWPAFARFQVSVLQADNTWMSVLVVTNSLGSIVAFPIWARYAERLGNLFMFQFAAVWLATAPVLTALSPNLPVLAAVNFFTGLGVAGVLLLVLQSLLQRCPQEDRPVYLAVHQALVSIAGAAAPIAGAALMSGLGVVGALHLAGLVRLLSAMLLTALYRWERREAGQEAHAA